LPTPGHTPLELDAADDDAAAAAAAVLDEVATYVPAIIMVAMASGSADFRSLVNPLQNNLILSLVIGPTTGPGVRVGSW
jgi:hypothetical protein